jgi:phosphoglycolate phosphatase
MPKQFDLIIFDWDGTLVDSTQMIVECLQNASKDCELSIPNDSEARGTIGLRLKEAFASLYIESSEQQLQELIDRYRHHYFARDNKVVLFEGVTNTVKLLHQIGFKLAIATGKERLGLLRGLEHTNLHHYFEATRCADDCRSKPHPQMLYELMGELDVKPARTLMIGDTSFDLEMARNADVKSVGVTYGAQLSGQWQHLNPIKQFNDFLGLSQWLLAHA